MKENLSEIFHKNARLQTKRLLLRRFTIEDTEDVYAYASDEQTVKYLLWSGVSNHEEARTAITDHYSKDGVYAIELLEVGRCIGCIGLNMYPEHEKASFGYVLNKAYWNKGYMSETLNIILKLCFEELDLNRVEANHYVGNEGSGNVMAKCGMVKEGIALSEVKIKGAFRDVVHYGITKEQWKKIAYE